MNKAQLIDALAERLGNRKVAASVVAGLVDVVVRTVSAGNRVTITGFGVFEKRARAARIARNPRTGQTVTVQQTDMPVFRPGTLFREVVSGTRTLPAGSVAASSSANSVPSRAPVTGATSRPATRASAAPRLTEVSVAPAQAGKAPKAKKAGKAAKANAEPKTAEGNAQGPSKATAKKSGKKSAGKK